MSALFSPITLGPLTLPNRVTIAPMCQYSAVDGVPQPWHWQHLGSLALSGASLVIVEATGVEPEGRISPACTGLWNDEQEAAFAKIIADTHTFCNTRFGIQLAHAGRKASTPSPFVGATSPKVEIADGGWEPVAPSAIPFAEGWWTPRALDDAGLERVKAAFVDAARRADRAGFDVVELHAAHGYLLHEFASALANQRTDRYGGSLENRLRFPLEVAEAVRAVWPKGKALGARITGSDWVEGGVTPAEATVFARGLEALGYDFVDVTSGAIRPGVAIPGREPGYQVPFAAEVKANLGGTGGLKVSTVGMIVTPQQAEALIVEGKADLIAIARAALDDPRWPIHAAAALGAELRPARQYMGGAPGIWPGYPLAHPG